MGDGGKGDRKSHHTGSLDRGRQYVGRDGSGNDEGDKSDKSDKNSNDCFIASVVYGDENALEVDVLREYRDKVLMQDEMGRKFVEFYYSGAGEKTAKFIKEKARFLIPIIRRGLDFIVEGYQNFK